MRRGQHDGLGLQGEVDQLDSEPELLDLVDQVAGVGGQAGGIDALAGHALDPGPQGTRRARSARASPGRPRRRGRLRRPGPSSSCSAPGGARDRVDEIDGIGRDPPFLAAAVCPRVHSSRSSGPAGTRSTCASYWRGLSRWRRSGSSAPRGRAAPPAAGRRARRRRRRSARPPRRGPRARPRLRSGSSRDQLGPRGAADSAGWAPRTRPRSCGAEAVQRRGGRKLDRAAAGRAGAGAPCRAPPAPRPRSTTRASLRSRPRAGAGIGRPGAGERLAQRAGSGRSPATVRRRSRATSAVASRRPCEARPATNPRTARRAESASTPAGSTSASVAVRELHRRVPGDLEDGLGQGESSTPSRASGAGEHSPLAQHLQELGRLLDGRLGGAGTASAVAVFASVSTRARRPSSRRSTPTSTWVPPRTHTSPLGTAPISHAGSARSVSVIAAIAREPARAARPGGGPAGSAPTT